ncbi:MAG: hypothetical protein ACK4NO_00480 [Glycocaulis sp.]
MSRGGVSTGVLAAFVVAPAFATAVAVAGLIGHIQITDPAAADVPLAAYLSLSADVWFSGLMFAYPATLFVFIPLWMILRGLGLWGGFTALLSGGAAGLAGMIVHLYRLYGADLESALTGGQPIGSMSVAEGLMSLALPLIGLVAGALGGLVFNSLSNGRR